jgi:hypothetical protein
LSSGDDADSDDDEAENVGGSNERVVDEVRDRLERLFKSGREWDHVVLERGEEDDFYVSCFCGIYHVSVQRKLSERYAGSLSHEKQDLVLNLRSEPLNWILKLT